MTARARRPPPAATVNPPPLRVVLVDDHDLVRDGLKALLRPCDDIEVVGEADSVSGAVSEVERCRPDVVVMDIRLRDGSGIDATRQILTRRPDTQVLVLTSSADEETLVDAIAAGAVGYVVKEIRGGQLVEAIRSIGQGHSPLEPALVRSLFSRVRQTTDLPDPKLARLNPQETRILSLLADGRSNQQIADTMCLAEKTVRNYISLILDKLEVTRRGEAVAYLARRQGRRPEH
jgi:two-component system response regulator DevR